MPGLRKAALIVMVDTAGGVVPVVLVHLFLPGESLHELWINLRFSLVYAHCIGTLCFVCLERLGRRRTGLPPAVQLGLWLVCLVGLALVGSLAANLAFVALGWHTPAQFWPQFRYGLRVAIGITIVIGAIAASFELLSDRLHAATLELRTRQLAEERARQAATEARLSSLESRIHPHFLFNTLNSISALIREDPACAERTVERLAALLRYSLDANPGGLVPLRRELRIVRDYLEIEKTRFGDRLRYSIEAPAGIAELEVPPLALQTLVENSIKHAVAANRRGGEIRVTARLGAGCLLLEVSDDGPGFDPGAFKPGHGLENLQGRLTALFDAAGCLDLERRDGLMVVGVSVPQKRVLV